MGCGASLIHGKSVFTFFLFFLVALRRTVLSCYRMCVCVCVCELSTGEVCSGYERLGTQQAAGAETVGRTVLSCCRISFCVCELSTGAGCGGDERLGTQQVDEQKFWEGLWYLVVEYLFVCV